MKIKEISPYQLFFPLGLFGAILSISIWFLKDLNWLSTPVILIHGKLIVSSFLWSFIIGFLMTTVPKITGTKKAHWFELFSLFSLTLTNMYQSFFTDGTWFYVTSQVLIFFLLIYVGHRVVFRKKKIPMFFSHIVIAIILALVGTTYYYRGNSYMGVHLYHVGSTLILVLGIGARFFTFPSDPPSLFEEDNRKSNFLFHFLGIIICALLCWAGQGYKIAYLALSFVTAIYLLFVWKIYRKSDHPSALKIGIRIIALAIPLSFFMCWLLPENHITWFHLLFICCFSIIIYALATGVVLTHGSYSLDLKPTSPVLWYVIFFLVLSTASRILYQFSDGNWKKSFLHLAASLWVLAIAFWCRSFFIKIIKGGSGEKSAC